MEKQTRREVKVDIDNGSAFFADELGVIHNPLKFIIDFRSITPRIDVRNKDFQPIVLKHNVVVMDTYTAKNLLDILKTNITNYEKRFGKIKKPEALDVIEKEAKKSKKKTSKKEMPSYFG
ncbi:DUF3467 domain-containing protein [Candidatus Woesearchaeota archaeon]|nr:DUF3467 domain-containing protein [Candidatus Woesearchaeota archaeon]